MRISDFINKKAPQQEEPRPAANPVPDSPAVALRASPTAPPPPAVDPSAGDTFYESTPVGIYQAAEELGISVPRSKESIVERAAHCLCTVFSQLSGTQRNPETVWPMIQSIAMELDDVVTSGKSIAPPIYTQIPPEKRLCWHSVHTALIAMDLATAVSMDRSSIQALGGACLLHDVGFLRMPNGQNLLLDEANPKRREHVFLGVEMAREIQAPDEVVRMISQHHERSDGQGYPAQISRDEFGRSSQIVALANIVELALAKNNAAAASGTVNGGGISSILDVLVAYRKAFDYDLLKAVLSHKGFYTIGAMVELTNRSVCQVTRLNPGFPLRPVVQVIIDGDGNHPTLQRIIDLKENGLLSIARLLP